MSKQIEERLANLEAEVAKLKHKIDAVELSQPWWEPIVGAFADNPAYEEAMRLGREYRRGVGSASLESVNE